MKIHKKRKGNEMKKIFRMTCIALGAVIMLSGCGTKTNDKTADGKVKLSVGGWPTKEGPALDSMNNALKRFNEKYGNEIEITPDNWTFTVETFITKAASGQLPNVYGIYFTELNRIVDAGYAADVTKQMKEYGYADKVNPLIEDMVKRDGKFYVIPAETYAMGLLANMNLLRQAGYVDGDDNPIFPKTYDELTEFAKTIAQKTGKAGFIMPTTGNNGGWHFTIIAWANGVNFMEKKDGKWTATFNTPECVEVLQWIKDMKWKYNALSSNALVDMAEAQKLYATDQGAFYFASKPSDTLISNYGMNKDDIAIGAIPAGKKAHVTLMGGSAKALSANSTEAQKDAAFKWFEYVSTTPFLTDAAKKSMEESIQSKLKENYIVGQKLFSPWSDDAEINVFGRQLRKENMNVKEGHLSQYENFDGITVKPEEPVCCQDLYGVLDSCIQAVLTDQNADCAALIANAAKDFQTNFLDSAE